MRAFQQMKARRRFLLREIRRLEGGFAADMAPDTAGAKTNHVVAGRLLNARYRELRGVQREMAGVAAAA